MIFPFLDYEITRRVDRLPLNFAGNTETRSQVCVGSQILTRIQVKSSFDSSEAGFGSGFHEANSKA